MSGEAGIFRRVHGMIKKKGEKHMETVWELGKAFLVGGAICVVGQLLLDKTTLTPARILVGFVVAGVLLGAAGVYEPLAQWAGAGATVPLVGFGYNMAKGTREAILSDGWTGILTGGLTAGAGGITVAVLCGVLASLVAHPKEK